MREKEIKVLENIIKKLKLGYYKNNDLGTAYEQANYIILKSETSDGVNDIIPMTSSIALRTLRQAHLRFGFTVIKELMTILSNPKLGNSDNNKYRRALNRLSGNSSKKSGELFIFNSNNPEKLRLAKSKDVMNAINQVITVLKQPNKIKS